MRLKLKSKLKSKKSDSGTQHQQLITDDERRPQVSWIHHATFTLPMTVSMTDRPVIDGGTQMAIFIYQSHILYLQTRLGSIHAYHVKYPVIPLSSFREQLLINDPWHRLIGASLLVIRLKCLKYLSCTSEVPFPFLFLSRSR